MKANLKTCVSIDFFKFDKPNKMMLLLNMGLITKRNTQKQCFLLVNNSEYVIAYENTMVHESFESDRMSPIFSGARTLQRF